MPQRSPPSLPLPFLHECVRTSMRAHTHTHTHSHTHVHRQDAPCSCITDRNRAWAEPSHARTHAIPFGLAHSTPADGGREEAGGGCSTRVRMSSWLGSGWWAGLARRGCSASLLLAMAATSPAARSLSMSICGDKRMRVHARGGLTRCQVRCDAGGDLPRLANLLFVHACVPCIQVDAGACIPLLMWHLEAAVRSLARSMRAKAGL